MGDLVDSAVPVAIVDAALEFGRLDCLVANAGFPILKSLSEGSDEEIEYAFRGNVISFFGLVRHALPLLQRAEHPRVVAVGSYTSHIFRNDVRSFPMSASSKGALEVAVRSLAIDLAPRGITVNCVVPGLIAKDEGTADALPETELRSCIGQIPLGRVGRPDDVAGAIQFFLSPEASYITGQLLHVNGGLVI
jgi:3-oxoacyl-[acyl-carrier protein] reductase